MITTPPSEHDLHAYVDHALSAAERLEIERYLQANPLIAAQVEAGQVVMERITQIVSAASLVARPAPEVAAPAPVAGTSDSRWVTASSSGSSSVMRCGPRETTRPTSS